MPGDARVGGNVLECNLTTIRTNAHGSFPNGLLHLGAAVTLKKSNAPLTRSSKGDTMKAIRTRYYGPTNTRGSRIVASDGDHNSISISYPHGLDSDKGHELAAYLLMQKMGWANKIIGGGFRHDMYWTMLPLYKNSLQSKWR